MKAAIVYYSTTGNTKLACKFVIKKISGIEIDLIDFIKCDPNTLAIYDAVGFAFFTDSWKPPVLLQRYVRSLNGMEGKYAFIFNTYGCISGQSTSVMYKLLREKGMTVFAAFSLHTPENYPPMIASGLGCANSPGKAEMRRLNLFTRKLQADLERIEQKLPVKAYSPKRSLLDFVLPAEPDRFTNAFFGKTKMEIDNSKCILCGLCKKHCPADAITIDDKVHIDGAKCQGCWSCYNHCPSKAVKAGKYTGQGQYRGPSDRYRSKFV